MTPRRHTSALAGLALALAAAPASAASVQVFTGPVEPDIAGFDSATAGGVRLGAEFADVGLAEFDAELEFATSIDEGDTASGTWDYQSIGAFVTARSAGAVYFIGRVGVVDQEIDPSGSGAISESGEAVGLGIGAGIGVAQFELLAQRQSGGDDLDDVDSITAALRFGW